MRFAGGRASTPHSAGEGVRWNRTRSAGAKIISDCPQQKNKLKESVYDTIFHALDLNNTYEENTS